MKYTVVFILLLMVSCQEPAKEVPVVSTPRAVYVFLLPVPSPTEARERSNSRKQALLANDLKLRPSLDETLYEPAIPFDLPKPATAQAIPFSLPEYANPKTSPTAQTKAPHPPNQNNEQAFLADDPNLKPPLLDKILHEPAIPFSLPKSANSKTSPTAQTKAPHPPNQNNEQAFLADDPNLKPPLLDKILHEPAIPFSLPEYANSKTSQTLYEPVIPFSLPKSAKAQDSKPTKTQAEPPNQNKQALLADSLTRSTRGGATDQKKSSTPFDFYEFTNHIYNTVTGRKKEIDECSLHTKPDRGAAIELTWLIDAKGFAKDISVKQNITEDQKAADCLIDFLKTVQFSDKWNNFKTSLKFILSTSIQEKI